MVIIASAMSFMAGTLQAFDAGVHHCKTTTDASHQARQEAFTKPRGQQELVVLIQARNPFLFAHTFSLLLLLFFFFPYRL